MTDLTDNGNKFESCVETCTALKGSVLWPGKYSLATFWNRLPLSETPSAMLLKLFSISVLGPFSCVCEPPPFGLENSFGNFLRIAELI